ncbi:MAG: VOC family protein [Xanthomonadales bacterium]|jgi:catechol 2,3-dioxygenase-like lactoylglutathione lyase family enzyme|nr:VOC family protein [Xanthomonadales bacterium]
MLKSILVVTLLVGSVPEAEQAYERELGYRTVDEGRIDASLAETWQAPLAAGRAFVLMQPESGENVFLRFVQTDGPGNYEPMKTTGWNAVELQATDPDTLVTELPPEQFELIGPPRYLTEQQNIRAAQVLGPHRELLYFTHVLDPGLSRFRIGTAVTRVDRVFIMVLGTTNLAATTTFYEEMLGMPVSGPFPYRVSVLSEAWDLPEDTLHDLSIVQLEAEFLIEIDAYPEGAPRRSPTAAGLPYGPAIVGFQVASLDGVAKQSGRPVRVLDQAPYDGREVLFLAGPSGEGIELIASRVVAGRESP